MDISGSHAADERLEQALRRYDDAYRTPRPEGSGAADDLVRARMDLTLLLLDTDDPLPDALMIQLPLDAADLLRATPPLGPTT